MYSDRLSHFREIEKIRNSRVLLYVTSDRQNMSSNISADVIDTLTDHLDKFNPDGRNGKISLILHSAGGNILAGWSIANLIRQFCRDGSGPGKFEVIIPTKAHSTATLISLAADKIVMTKQSTLGAIDPSVNSPLNPPVPESPQQKVSINVECVASFMELARHELSTQSAKITPKDLIPAFTALSQSINPYVLGAVYRTREQIRELARRLLATHMTGKSQATIIRKIIDVLSSTSGSHDYTICRTEALDLGLPIEKPDNALYAHIKAIYKDFSNELELNTPWNASAALGDAPSVPYRIKRGLIESVTGGSDSFVSSGRLTRVPVQQAGMHAIRDDRTMDCWTHDLG